MKHDSWAVSAALLLRNRNKMMHYEEITAEVIGSKLTTLGEKGKTPERSLRSIMGSKSLGGKKVFSPCGEGYYELADEAKIRADAKVRSVLRALAE